MSDTLKFKSWNPDTVVKMALRQAEKRMVTATLLVEREVKQSLNVSNRGGTEPSPAGSPPRKGIGELQRSIVRVVKRGSRDVRGFIGSTSKKARRLELGFVGKDSLGRTYDQQPRPFLRPAFHQSLDRVKKILGAK